MQEVYWPGDLGTFQPLTRASFLSLVCMGDLGNFGILAAPRI